MMPIINKHIKFITSFLLLSVGLCLIYNIYALFFPISTQLEADGSEHLHAAYLLSIGERPYLDYIQNHPMLFHHYIVWAEKAFDITSTRHLAATARIPVFSGFILCLVVFCLWTSRILKNRPKGLLWVSMLIAAWAMLDIYKPEFQWMWELRPDFICYGLTLLGLYLIHLWIVRRNPGMKTGLWFLAALGGCLIGFGNAVIPKGIPFLGAFVLSFFTAWLLGGQAVFSTWLNRKNLLGLLLISIVAALSFFACVALDCHLSNVSFHNWFAAVFLLNSRKHIIYANIETNPVTPILEMLSLPMVLAVALMVWAIWEVINLNKTNRLRDGSVHIWTFSIFTFLINVMLPVYSTGVTWNYYFIPSLFSVASLCLMLLMRLKDVIRHHPFAGKISPQHGVIVLVYAIIAILILNAPFRTLEQRGSRHAAAKEVAATCPSDYLNDLLLPEGLIYMGNPAQLPIRSRSWGYYFMLVRSTNFWRDCHALGFGPDPQEAWENGFAGNPPDAITLTTPDDLDYFIFMARECHKVDVSWLPDAIQKRYILMNRKWATLYVRKDRLPEFISMGWHELPRLAF